MIEYRDTADGLDEPHLEGFFEGWPDPPSAATHLRLLRESDAVIVAVDDEPHVVAGFITAHTDGVLSAYIPLLEVRPAYRGRGIGGELVRRMLARLGDLYMVDLVCDTPLVPFYERHGMRKATAMALRRYEKQSGSIRDGQE